MRLTVLIVLALVTIVLGMIVTDAVDSTHLPAVPTTTTSTSALPTVFDAAISDDAAVAPVVVTRHEIPRAHETAPMSVGSESTWDRLADCESGDWDKHGVPIPGTADWASTSDGYEGGVHFTNGTWLGAGGGAFAGRANLAARSDQIAIGKVVLRRQGTRAWPVCGPKVGLTMADAA